MNNNTYDNTRIIIKKRKDNSLIAIVEYYKNKRLVDIKRTANISFVLKLLKTASNGIKKAEYVGTSLEANYQSNGIIVVENYNSVKNDPEFKDFNNKVSKKIKKEKTVKKENKSNDKGILKGVKNLKVTSNKNIFKKIALKTARLLPIAALSTIVMIQVVSIVKTLPKFEIFTKSTITNETKDSKNLAYESITTKTSNINITETNDGLEVKVSPKKQETKSKKQDSQNKNSILTSQSIEPIVETNSNEYNNSETKENAIQESVNSSSPLTEVDLGVGSSEIDKNIIIAEPINQSVDITPITNQNEKISQETQDITTFSSTTIEPTTNVEVNKNNDSETNRNAIEESIYFTPSLTEVDLGVGSSKIDKNIIIAEPINQSTDVTTKINQNEKINQDSQDPITFSSTIAEPITNTDINKNNDSETAGNLIQESANSTSTLTEVNLGIESSEETDNLIINETAIVEQMVEVTNQSFNENVVNDNQVLTETEVVEENNNQVDNVEAETENQTYTSLVPTFDATPYTDITEEEYRAFVAMVQSEAGGTTKEEHYTDALAVASTPLNRLEDKEWRETCGDTLMEQIQADEQFEGTKTTTYRKVYQDITKASPEVVQAVNDALSGTRNSPYLSFRAKENKKAGRVQFVSGGNNYFGLSDTNIIENDSTLENSSFGSR